MEDNSKQDSSQVQVVSLDTISDIIKEAFGGVQDYIDDALTTTKRQVLDSNKIQLKFKGNTIQVEKAISKLNKGDPESAVLADRSEHGWKVVEEYETEELAEDSDDEKKIKSAIKSAAAKQKAKPSKFQPRKAPYYKRAPETHPNPATSTSSHNFCRFNPQYPRLLCPSPTMPRPSDLCFTSGKPDHWRRNCTYPAYPKSTEHQGGNQP